MRPLELEVYRRTEHYDPSPTAAGLAGPIGNSGGSPFSAVSVAPEEGFRWERAALWGGVNLTAMGLAYRSSQAAWGPSRGKFHFKDDLRGDWMALNDEVSHLFAAYRLTQILDAGYGWVGMNPHEARRASAWQAWLWMFAVEFPIDAFNPDQGFGVSDVVANTVGVLAASRRSVQTDPRWDIKISLKPSYFEDRRRVIAYTNEQYDNYIYWLTVRPVRNRWVPISAGVGYSTSHGEYPVLHKEVHFGVGVSIDKVGEMIDPSVGRFLRPLNFYFLNLGGKIVLR